MTLSLAALVLSLGIDTFAVAVALGMAGLSRRQRVRAGISFAAFEGVMPIVGFALGRTASNSLGNVASGIGIAVLFGVGLWMLYESLRGDEDEARDLRVDSLPALLVTSLSVSMDELAVGFSMGALGLPIALTVALIAAQAFLITWLGSALGRRVGETFAERAESAAGIVLCGLAVVLTVERLGGIG
jgi:manganese efflux pump family protein